MNINTLATDIHYEVQGTSNDLSNYTEEYLEKHNIVLTNEEHTELLGELDNLGFNCVVCGWHYEIGDVSNKHDELVCTGCENEY